MDPWPCYGDMGMDNIILATSNGDIEIMDDIFITNSTGWGALNNVWGAAIGFGPESALEPEPLIHTLKTAGKIEDEIATVWFT